MARAPGSSGGPVPGSLPCEAMGVEEGEGGGRWTVGRGRWGNETKKLTQEVERYPVWLTSTDYRLRVLGAVGVADEDARPWGGVPAPIGRLRL